MAESEDRHIDPILFKFGKPPSAFGRKKLMSAAFNCGTCAVRHRAICRALRNVELDRLDRISRKTCVPAGQPIFLQYKLTNFFAIIVSGVAKLIKSTSDGREQIVGLLYSSDFLGLDSGECNPCFATAISDVELCCLPRGQFQKVLREYPHLEHQLLMHALNERKVFQEWILLLGKKDAEERVASFLCMIAQRTIDAGCLNSEDTNFTSFILPLSRSEIANYLGLTLETVSRKITRLKSEGLIYLPKKREVVVPNLKKLCETAKCDVGMQ